MCLGLHVSNFEMQGGLGCVSPAQHDTQRQCHRRWASHSSQREPGDTAAVAAVAALLLLLLLRLL